jgi:hypothetical protein
MVPNRSLQKQAITSVQPGGLQIVALAGLLWLMGNLYIYRLQLCKTFPTSIIPVAFSLETCTQSATCCSIHTKSKDVHTALHCATPTVVLTC